MFKLSTGSSMNAHNKQKMLYNKADMENRQKWVYAAVFIAAAVLIGGYFYYWENPVDEKKIEEEVAAPPKASAPAVSGTLPSINTQTNVLEKVPEINPVDKVNPFKDVYKNPFE